MRVLSYILIILLQTLSLFSQENDKSKLKLDYNGSLSVGSVINHSFTDQPNQLRNSYFIAGNFNMSVNGFRVPASLYFNNRTIGLQRSTIFLGIKPTIRKTKIHLGFSSMNFSKYFLNGSTFIGAGIESEWRGITVSAMSGRLKNILPDAPNLNTTGLEFLQEYNRSVHALKVGYKSGNSYAELIGFYGQDLFNTIEDPVPTERNVDFLPKENLGIGLNSRIALFKKVRLGIQTILSAFTEDAEAEAITLNTGRLSFLTNIFQPNLTTYLSYAATADLTFTHNNNNLGIVVERVSPEFRTIGTYFYYADFVNYTISLDSKIGRKVTLNGNFGYQKNNLSDRSIFKNQRRIFSLNLRYVPDERFNISSRVTNYNLDKSPELQVENDSIRVVSIQSSAQVIPSYSFGRDKRFSLRAIANYRLAENRFSLQDEESSTAIWLTKLFLNGRLSNYQLRVGVGYSKFQLEDFPRSTITSDINVSTTLFDRKASVQLGSSYNVVEVIGKSNGYFFRSNANFNYSITSRLRFNMGLYHFYRQANVGQNNSDLRVQTRMSFAL